MKSQTKWLRDHVFFVGERYPSLMLGESSSFLGRGTRTVWFALRKSHRQHCLARRYRSIWGNSNRQLTLAPIDRDQTLSLEDNCMLVSCLSFRDRQPKEPLESVLIILHGSDNNTGNEADQIKSFRAATSYRKSKACHVKGEAGYGHTRLNSDNDKANDLVSQ